MPNLVKRVKNRLRCRRRKEWILKLSRIAEFRRQKYHFELYLAAYYSKKSTMGEI